MAEEQEEAANSNMAKYRKVTFLYIIYYITYLFIINKPCVIFYCNLQNYFRFNTNSMKPRSVPTSLRPLLQRWGLTDDKFFWNYSNKIIDYWYLVYFLILICLFWNRFWLKFILDDLCQFVTEFKTDLYQHLAYINKWSISTTDLY